MVFSRPQVGNAVAVLAISLAAVLAVPSVVRADPILVTGGFMASSINISEAMVRMQGDDFFLNVGVEGFFSPLRTSCSPCVGEQDINLGGEFGNPVGGGSARVNGVDYPTIFIDGMTGTFTTPDTTLDFTDTQLVTVPFQYSGRVNGFLVNPFVEGFTDPVFSIDLLGSGTASAVIFAVVEEGTTFYSLSEIRYDFEPAGPAPIPEPATMLLCGFGTAALAVMRRRREGTGIPD